MDFFSLRKSCLRALFLVFLCNISGVTLFAQEKEDIDPMPIKLKAQVLNLEDESPVPFAFVLNFRTHSGVTTDDKGRFTMDMMNVDSLAVSSLAFAKTIVHVPANYNEMNVLIIYVKPNIFDLPGVNVQGEKKKFEMEGLPSGKIIDIDPRLRGDAYNTNPSILAAFFNPASFLQYYLSKSEREKRETRIAILTEKKWEHLSQYYKKELVMELTGLDDSEADNFMLYVNSKGLLSQMSTEYDVRAVIREQFIIYKQEGH
jgi:hypothetical protein